MRNERDKTVQKLKKTTARNLLLVDCCAIALLLCCVIALPAYATSQGGEILSQIRDWNDPTPNAGLQNPDAMVMDSSGNIIVTGYSDQSGSIDYYTVKFSADLSTVLWQASYNDSYSRLDRSTAIAVDSNNDVIVTGYVWNGTNYDIYTVKYNASDGAIASGWPKIFNNLTVNGNDYATSIAIDSSNNIYAGGFTQASNGKDDYLIIKYTSGGSLDTSFGSPNGYVTYNNSAANGDDRVASITVGSTGVAATGYSESSRAEKDFDCLTIKYNTSGTKLWEYRHDMSSDNRGKLVRMDSAGNVIMAGYEFNGTDRDIHVTKFDTSGTKLWQAEHSGGYSDDEPYALIVDSSDNIYMTGNSFSINTSNDFYTAKYNSSGEIQWSAQLNTSGGNDEIPVGIALNSATGEVFVTGYTIDAVTHNYDWLTAKYTVNGDLLWTKSFNGSANKNDRPVGISVLQSTGEVYVAGWSDMWTSGASDYDFYAVRYDPGILNRPTRLTATTINLGEVDLAWIDNSTSTNEDGFVIDRCEGTACDFSVKNTFTVGQNATSYPDNTVVADKTYRYRVYAYKGADNSYYSDMAETTTTVLSPTAPSWSFRYDGGGSDEASSIAVGTGTSGDQNPVITGYSYIVKGVDEEGHPLGNYDYYTIKLNRTNAGVPLWKGAWNDSYLGEDYGMAITVDNSNDVIVSGYGPSPDGDEDIYTMKYDGSGDAGIESQLWNSAERYGNSSYDFPVAAVTDDLYKTYIAGYGMNNKSGRNDEDIYIIKYPNCNDPGETCPRTWAVTYDGGQGDDRPSEMVVDADGNVYMTGYTALNGETGTATGGSIITLQNTSNSWAENFWNHSYLKMTSGLNANSFARAILSNTGDTLTLKSPFTYDVSAGDTYYIYNFDYYTAKFDKTDGHIIWSKTYNGSGNGNDLAKSIAIGASNTYGVPGNVYVTGSVTNTNGKKDFYTVKYNSTNGDIIWAKSYGASATADYEAVSVRVDPIDDQRDDGVIVAGTTITETDNHDFYVIRYDEDGGITWQKKILRPGYDDIAKAMAVDPSGSVCIAGDSGTVPALDLLAVKLPYTGEIKTGWATIFDGSAHNTDVTAAVISNDYGEMFVGGTANYSTNADYVAFMCKGDSIVVPAPFTLTAVAGNADNNQQINLAWSNTMLSGATFTLDRIDNTCSSPPCSWVNLLTNSSSISTSDTGLLVDNKYCYRLKATKGGVDSRVLGRCKITTRIPPSLKPLLVLSTSAIDITWDRVPDINPASNSIVSTVLGYKLERNTGASCNAGAWTQVGGQFDSDTLIYHDTGLAAGTTYCYRLSVLSVKDIPEYYSQPGPVVSATTVPPQPTWNNSWSGTPFSSITTTSITVNWNTTVGATSYTLQYKLAGDSYADAACSPTSSISCTVGSLSTGSQYYFRVKAVNAAGESVWSNEVNGFTLPPTPTLTSVIRESNCTATINWDDVAGETAYYVDYSYCWDSNNPGNCSKTSGNWQNWAGYNRPGQNATSTTFSLSTGYAYRIRVYSTVNSGNTYSAASNEGSVWACMSSVTQYNIAPLSDTSLQISWTDILGNTNFDVHRRDCSGNCAGNTCVPSVDYRTVAELGGNTTAWNDTGLNQSASYAYKIKAYRNLSDSYPAPLYEEVWSNEQCFKTPPPSPSTVTATASSTALAITVQWCQSPQSAGCTADPSPYNGYVIERSGNGYDDPGTDGNPGYWGGFSTLAAIGGNQILDSSFENSTSWTPMNNSPSLCAIVPSGVPVLTNDGGGSWTKQVKLVIDDFQANYQTRVVIPYNTDMKADFSDIRFYDTTASLELPYWIESKTNSSTATCWIRTGANNNIYMYYGNPSATNSSNGTNTFEFFDDFTGTTIDTTNKWNKRDDGNFISQNDELIIADGKSDWLSTAMASKQDFARDNLVAQAKYRSTLTTGNPYQDTTMLMWRDAGTGTSYTDFIYALYFHKHNTTGNGLYIYEDGGNGASVGTFTANTQYWVRQILKPGGGATTEISTDGNTWSPLYNSTYSVESPLKVGFTHYQGGIVYIDDFIVRKYTSTGPTASFCSGIIDSSNPEVGVLSLNLSSDGTIPSLGRYQSVTVTPGEYVLSGYFNTDLTQGRARCEVYDGATVHAGVEQTGNSGGWVKLTTPVTIPSGTTSVNIRCFADSSPNGTAFVDLIELYAETTSSSSRTYIDTNVGSSYAYRYRVRGTYNDNGNTAYTAYAPLSDPYPYARTIPPTPAITSLTADSSSQITVYWSDVPGNTGFNVQWIRNIDDPGSECTTGWETATTVGFGQTTYQYSHTGRTEGYTYCYRIQSYNGTGSSAYSSPSRRMTLLSPPSGINLVVFSSTEIQVNWLTVTGNQAYYIERSTTGGDPWTYVATTAKDVTTYFNNTGLSAGTRYYYRIYTQNNEGNWSVASAPVSKVTKPAAPVSLSLSVVSDSQIDISWQVSLGAEKYLVEGTIGVGGAWETVADLSVAYGELYCGYYTMATVACPTLIPKYTSTSSTALEKDTEYCYKVTAWNADGGYSVPGSTICAMTRSINAPVLISVTTPKSREADLLWSYSPIGDSPDGFEIESKAGTDSWKLKDTVADPSATIYSDKVGLQPNTKYTYRVRTYKLSFNDGFNAINPLIWTQPTSVPNGYGSASVTSTGSSVRLNTISNSSGTAGTYNYSAISLINPEVLSGDFDVQADYALPNGQITAGRYNVYARVLIYFPASAGNNNYILAERSINYYGGAWKNLYQGTVVVNGVGNSDYFETSDTSGKLRITKNGSSVSAYALINGIWYLLTSNNGITLQSAPTSIWLIQYAQQGEGVNLTTDFDNFKVITKSVYSNEKSATTPAWQSSDEECQ